ncbi:MAG: hypothetical protein QOD99_2325 [Chthoniobacter sp.]|nr:hypothetical protein [Chthoniobacter sp.]
MIVLCALMGSCAHRSGGGHAGEKYVVNSQRTLFYRFGPAQSNGPDFALYKGQRLTMLSQQFGYSHITTEDGQLGYVSTEDIAPAPPEPTPSPTPARRKSEPANRATIEEQKLVPLPPLPGE